MPGARPHPRASAERRRGRSRRCRAPGIRALRRDRGQRRTPHPHVPGVGRRARRLRRGQGRAAHHQPERTRAVASGLAPGACRHRHHRRIRPGGLRSRAGSGLRATRVTPGASLPAMDVGARMPRLRAALGDLDALLITRLANIRYLSGFTGSAATLLVGREAACFVSDGRYAEQSREQLGAAGCDARVEIASSGAQELLVEALAGWGTRRLGFEAHGVTWAEHRSFGEAFPVVELVATEHAVEELRRVKDPAEVARIRAACEIGDDAFREIVGKLADEPSEQEVALALETAMRERGAEATSFDP